MYLQNKEIEICVGLDASLLTFRPVVLIQCPDQVVPETTALCSSIPALCENALWSIV